jgi:hypothetical protein
MNLELSADRIFVDKRIFVGRNSKKKRSLFQLSVLATEARTGIDENQQLNVTIKILDNLVKKNKLILKKITSYNKISKKEIETNLIEVKNEFLTLNKTLKGERNFFKIKNAKARSDLEETLKNLKTDFDILVNRKFIYANALVEKENIIKKFKHKIKTFCAPPYPLTKEELRERFLDISDSDERFSEFLERLQADLMSISKEFNQYQNRCVQLLKYKKVLLDIIDDIKFNRNYDHLLENSNENKIDEYIEKINNEDSFLNESITSVYEESYNNIEFPIIINEKCLIKKSSLYEKFNFPKLSLGQIIYNKKRFKPEDAEKSLSRNLPNSRDLDIKKMKENIKKMKKKNKLQESRIKEFEEKIKKMQDILESYTSINEKKDDNEISKEEEKSKTEKPLLIYSV